MAKSIVLSVHDHGDGREYRVAPIEVVDEDRRCIFCGEQPGEVLFTEENPPPGTSMVGQFVVCARCLSGAIGDGSLEVLNAAVR